MLLIINESHLQGSYWFCLRWQVSLKEWMHAAKVFTDTIFMPQVFHGVFCPAFQQQEHLSVSGAHQGSPGQPLLVTFLQRVFQCFCP